MIRRGDLRSRVLESAFQRKVTAKLKSLQNTWFYKASERATRGIPDIIMSVNGKFFAMELKRDRRSKPTKLQDLTIERIRKSNGQALVVFPENWDETYEMLQMLAGDLPVGVYRKE